MVFRRPDASPARGVPAYRRMMPFLMKGRNESAVYFEQQIDVSDALDELGRFTDESGTKVSPFDLVAWALATALHQRPRLNRFVAGGRLWQRDGIWLSYSAKARMDDDSPVVVRKRRFDPGASFAETVRTLRASVGDVKRGKKAFVDNELNTLTRLPGPALRALLGVQRRADALGLLPKQMIDNDPMYASAFIANLGSIDLDAGYHHLYEYGNIPVFCVIGRVEERPRVVAGAVVPRRTLTLRWSYDERVEDGLYAARALELVRELVESGGAVRT